MISHAEAVAASYATASSFLHPTMRLAIETNKCAKIFASCVSLL